MGHGSTLIGRAAEIERLRSAVTAVAGGSPRTVLLTGLAGVGKSRLAHETLALAAAAGFATFSGSGRVLGRDLAYAPVAEAFGGCLRAMDGPRRAELLGDLPQLGLVFSGLGLAEPIALDDPALERFRLVDGLVRLVERLADDRPLAWLLDDAHLADPATTALLHHLPAGAADQPVLLLVTARAEDGDRVAELATGWAGTPWPLEQLEVTPLGEADARAVVEDVLGHRVDDHLAGVVLGRCAGRPLFLEAVARTLEESGRLEHHDGVLYLAGTGLPLPGGIRHELRARLFALGPDERALLELIAVADAHVEHEVLHRAGGLPPEATVRALERLDRRGLVVSPPPDLAFDVAHGLLRDAVLADLSPVATRQAHARLADALGALRPDDPRIPEHVLGAGPLVAPDRALGQLRAGAARARRVGATDEAARYLEAAVAVARSQGRTDLLADLLAELGAAWSGLGALGSAGEAWEAAAREYSRRGEAVGVSRAERELALVAWAEGDHGAARRRFDAAERALEGLEPSPAHAELLHARTRAASRVGDWEVVEATARELRRLAEQLGSASLAARAYLAEAFVCGAATDCVAMTTMGARALEAATASGDRMLVAAAYDQLSVAAACQGDVAELRRCSTESLGIYRQAGARALEPWPRARLALADLLAGQWDGALRGTAEGMALVRRWGEPRGQVSMLAEHAWILVRRGRLHEARACLEEGWAAAAEMSGQPAGAFGVLAVAGGILALAEGDPQEACRRTAQLERFETCWIGVLAAAVLGEASVRAGDLETAGRVADRVRSVRSCATGLPAAVADWVDGLADAAAGRTTPAVARLRASAGAFDELGLRFHAARAGLATASAGGDVDAARRALEVFEELGAPIEASEARRVLRGLGVVPARGRPAPPTEGPFSRRELEVARLVAAGLSNVEVADRLFISPRTVTTHLNRIYTRLELSSRTALTRYLADSGLLGEPVAAG